MPLPPFEELQKRFFGISELAHLDGGGQKTVLSGVHATHGDIVLKLTDTVDARTQREIEIVTTTQFPGVPTLFGWGVENFSGTDVLYLIEERIIGRSLRATLEDGGSLDFLKAIDLLDFLLESVVRFEQERLVHRDIKPENLMTTNDGRFFILDFGIARALNLSSLTATASRFGPATFGYAAPEQHKNMKSQVDSRADLFSIGVVFYECVTGINPFTSGAKSVLEVIRRIEKLQPDKLQLPQDPGGDLASFIDMLLQKSPLWRPGSAAKALELYQSIKNRMAGEA